MVLDRLWFELSEVGYPESGKCDDEGKKKTVEKYRALVKFLELVGTVPGRFFHELNGNVTLLITCEAEKVQVQNVLVWHCSSLRLAAWWLLPDCQSQDDYLAQAEWQRHWTAVAVPLCRSCTVPVSFLDDLGVSQEFPKPFKTAFQKESAPKCKESSGLWINRYK